MPYVEGDDLHPMSNVEKMSSGRPLTDADREPWLKLIRATAEHMIIETDGNSKRGVVISCSALKRCYRDILRGLGQQGHTNNIIPEHSQLKSANPILKTFFVHIEGTRDVLMDRMMKRTGHFMKPSMLDSQLETLENPAQEEDVIVISLTDSSEDQVRAAQQGLRRALHMPDDSTIL